MKKNMLLAIIIATFFSCTELLDEISITEDGKELLEDSIQNIIGKEDSVEIEDPIPDEVDTTTTTSPDFETDGVFTQNKNSRSGKKEFNTAPTKTRATLVQTHLVIGHEY